MSSPESQKKLTLSHTGGQKLRVLVAPLDWGLGHATRCIPIIQYLINNGVEVLLAGDGKICSLLTEAFPRLPFLPLKGYSVHYSGQSMLWSMAQQVPKILSAIRAEHRWVEETVQQYSIDLVISDNRYGLYHSTVPAVIITHQLRIQSGVSARADDLLQRWHYKLLNRFSFCWVPDVAESPGLAATLSHPQRLPSVPTHYIGPQSRLQPAPAAQKTIDLLFLLSGPEPQRSIFEQQVLEQIKNYSGNVVLVRGLPGAGAPLSLGHRSLIVHDHLPAEALAKTIHSAQIVICRSGYSTIMDLAALGAQALLVPTPGQTEQELLALHAQQQGWACTVSQKEFSLAACISASGGVQQFPQLAPNEDALQSALDAVFQRVR